MPSDFALKTLNLAHRLVLTGSGGKLGWSAGKMPVLELTTTGRKSGKQRSVLLTSPHQDGDKVVIIASAGGNDEHPAWFLNLRDNPQVTVRTDDGPKTMTARTATGKEREQLWSATVAKYRNYGEYQARTSREIPVVVLEPTS